MTNWLFIDLSVFLCVVAITGIIIPQILLIAFRKQLFDTPDPRKIHKAEIPRLGGIAFSRQYFSLSSSSSAAACCRRKAPLCRIYTTTYAP